MPEYLAPGVYVEEVSYRSKSIEGVSTTTTGFVGPTRYGPVDLEPDLITSLGEFERIYGDGKPLDVQRTPGRSRTSCGRPRARSSRRAASASTSSAIFRPRRDPTDETKVLGDGFARAWLPVNAAGAATDPAPSGCARGFPGPPARCACASPCSSARTCSACRDGVPTLGALQHGDIVWISDRTAVPANGRAYRVEEYFDDELAAPQLPLLRSRDADAARPRPSSRGRRRISSRARIACRW